MKDVLVATIDGVEVEVNRRRAERSTDRAFRFLRGVGLYPEILERLYEAGYTTAIHKQGWDLLHQSSGYSPESPVRISESHREAIMNLDAWDEPHFRRAKGALQHRFPSQYAYIFDGLSAQQGYGALNSVQTFLRRAEALRDGTDPARKASREHDKKAFALLEQRKILAPEMLQQLHEWIKSAEDTPELPRDTEEQKKYREQTYQALARLTIWLDEWAEVARAQITKRNYLISLGLATRRTVKEDDEEEEDTPTPAPVTDDGPGGS